MASPDSPSSPSSPPVHSPSRQPASPTTAGVLAALVATASLGPDKDDDNDDDADVVPIQVNIPSLGANFRVVASNITSGLSPTDLEKPPSTAIVHNPNRHSDSLISTNSSVKSNPSSPRANIPTKRVRISAKPNSSTPAVTTVVPDRSALRTAQENVEHFAIFASINEENLREITGAQDLSLVSEISLEMDSEEQQFSLLGDFLPALRRLTLDYGSMSSLRDLGHTLQHLRMLSVTNCGLSDLDGIEALPKLVELNASHNKISDLSALSSDLVIQVLDLSYNPISEVVALDYLSSLPGLKALNLFHSPITARAKYRRMVASRVPSLQSLDGVKISPAERAKCSPSEEEEIDERKRQLLEDNINVLVIDHDAWEPITESLSTYSSTSAMAVEEPPMVPRRPPGERVATASPVRRVISPAGSNISSSGSPSRCSSTESKGGEPQAAFRPRLQSCVEQVGSPRLERTGSGSMGLGRPSSAVRPGSARLGSARPASARPMTAVNQAAKLVTPPTETDSSSDLTYGNDSVLCGNFASSLRGRRTQRIGSPTSADSRSAGSNSVRSLADFDGAEPLSGSGAGSPGPVRALYRPSAQATAVLSGVVQH